MGGLQEPLAHREGLGHSGLDFSKNGVNLPVLADDYRSGKFGLVIEVWVWSGRGDRNPHCYVTELRANRLQLDAANERTEVSRSFAVDEGARRRKIKAHDLGDVDRRLDQSVLVSVGEVGKPTEFIPTTEFLKHFDLIGGPGIDVFQEAMVQPLGGFVDNRKLNVPRFFVGWLASKVLSCERPPKMVERAAIVVDGVSEDQAPVVADFRYAIGAKNDGLVFAVVLPGKPDGRLLLAYDLPNIGHQLIRVAISAIQLEAATGGPEQRLSHGVPS